MSVRLIELRQKRGEAVDSMRKALDVAASEKRELSSEENSKYEGWDGEQEALKSQIDREERQESLDREAAEAVVTGKVESEVRTDLETADKATEATGLEERAYGKFLAEGRASLSADEARALKVGTDSAGGFLTVPEKTAKRLIQAINDLVFIRQHATVETLTDAVSLGNPTLSADPADADWTTEILSGSEDSTMAFGKRTLTPSPVAKRIKVSRQLLQLAVVGAEAKVRERLAYKFAITEEKAFMTGDGSNKPLGVFVASASGISTGRDTVVGTTTAITGDKLIDVKYALKTAYLPNARWIFHRDAIKMLRKLKTTDLQYIWQPGLAGDRQDTILDVPFDMSEYAPNTFTTGLYVGIIGDFRSYMIADALNIQIQRLDELYAETNQVGFIGRKETDGAPVLEDAFRRAILA